MAKNLPRTRMPATFTARRTRGRTICATSAKAHTILSGNQKVPDQPSDQARTRSDRRDVRGEPVPTENFELPEGLKRPRMGPYDRDRKRDDIPNEVPGPKGPWIVLRASMKDRTTAPGPTLVCSGRWV